MADWHRVPLTTALTRKGIDAPAVDVCVPAPNFKHHAAVDIVATAGTLTYRGRPTVYVRKPLIGH